MARKDSRNALITSWENTNLPDNNSKTITPELLRTAVTDLFDTLIANYQTVANITALNALVLGTDFKENDIVYVTDIGEGDLKGVYQYLPARSSGTYSWQLLVKFGNNTKLITATQATISTYISTDWTDGDLAIGYLVKLTTGQIYVLIQNNGSSTGDYQEITGLLNIVEDTSPQLGGDLDANNKRILASQGDDVASPVSNNLSLDETNDGNVYSITGTNQINLIDSSQWQNGAEVVLKFDGALTIKNNQASSGDNKKIILSSGADHLTTAGDVLVLRLIDAEWREQNNLSTAKLEVIQFACSDETTDLETGTGVITFRMPFAMTVTEVRASVATAPTGANLEVDINEGGVSILSTVLSIDVSEKTSTTATTPAVISDSALADDAEITVDIDQIGSTVAGAGLKVAIIGKRV